jgi:hypothetical protein
MSKMEQFVASPRAMLLYAASTNVRLVSLKGHASECFVSLTLITVHASPTP